MRRGKKVVTRPPARGLEDSPVVSSQRHLFLSIILACACFSYVPGVAAISPYFGTNTCGATTTIKFAQSSDQSGALSAIGIGMRLGIEAAFKEVNNSGGVRGLYFQLDSKDDVYNPVNASKNAMTFTNQSDIFGMIGWVGTANAEASLPIILPTGMPFIGVFSGGNQVLREPYNRQIVNFRPSYLDETATMVEYLINVRRFSRIAVLMQNDSFGEACKEGVRLALESNNLRIHSEGRYAPRTTAIESALKIITESEVMPEAVIVAGIADPSAYFIQQASKVLPRETIYMVPSVVAQAFVDILMKAPADKRPVMENIIVTQVVPLPYNTSLPIVSRYQAALRLVNSTIPFDFSSLEGYLVGRMAIDIVRRLGTNYFTREMFLEAAYDSGSFNFDGLRCGPLLPKEVKKGCNVCMRTVAMTTISPQGTYQQLLDQPDLRFETCGYRAKVWTFLKFGQSAAMKGSRSSIPVSFNAGIRAAFQDVNDRGGLLGIKLDIVAKDDKDDPTIARQNIREFANDSSILAIVGSSLLPSQLSKEALLAAKEVGLPFVGSPSGGISLRTPFDRHAINFRASYFDEAMAMITFLYKVENITRVSAVFSDDSLGLEGRDLVAAALSSKRLTLYTEYSFSSQPADIPTAIAGLEGGEGAPQAVVMIGPVQLLGSFVKQAKAKWKENVWYLAFSSVNAEEFAQTLALGLPGSSESEPLISQNVLIAQVVPLPTDTNLKAVRSFQGAMRRLDKAAPLNSAAFEGYLTASMLINALQRLGGEFNRPEKLLDAFYDSGSFSMEGVHCGPLLSETGADGAGGEGGGCNQCMKKVWLAAVDQNGSLYLNPKGEHSFEASCGSPVVPNADFKLGSAQLAVVVVAAFQVFLTLVLMALLCYHRHYILIRGSFRFSLVTCLGGVLCYSAIFAMYPIPTDAVCLAQPWIGHLSFCFIFGPLFAKTRRVAMIFTNKKLSRVLITDAQVMGFFAGILLFYLLHLCIWTGLDPPRMVEAITSEQTPHRYEDCASTYSWGPWGIVVVEGLMLLWGCLLCFRVQGVNGKFQRFNESRQIGFAIYNTSFLGALLIFLTFIDFHPNDDFILTSTFIMMNTTVVLVVLFGKPVYFAVTGVSITEAQLAGTSATTGQTEGSANNNASKKEGATAPKAWSARDKNPKPSASVQPVDQIAHQ